MTSPGNIEDARSLHDYRSDLVAEQRPYIDELKIHADRLLEDPEYMITVDAQVGATIAEHENSSPEWQAEAGNEMLSSARLVAYINRRERFFAAQDDAERAAEARLRELQYRTIGFGFAADVAPNGWGYSITAIHFTGVPGLVNGADTATHYQITIFDPVNEYSVQRTISMVYFGYTPVMIDERVSATEDILARECEDTFGESEVVTNLLKGAGFDNDQELDEQLASLGNEHPGLVRQLRARALAGFAIGELVARTGLEATNSETIMEFSTQLGHMRPDDWIAQYRALAAERGAVLEANSTRIQAIAAEIERLFREDETDPLQISKDGLDIYRLFDMEPSVVEVYELTEMWRDMVTRVRTNLLSDAEEGEGVASDDEEDEGEYLALGDLNFSVAAFMGTRGEFPGGGRYWIRRVQFHDIEDMDPYADTATLTHIITVENGSATELQKQLSIIAFGDTPVFADLRIDALEGQSPGDTAGGVALADRPAVTSDTILHFTNETHLDALIMRLGLTGEEGDQIRRRSITAKATELQAELANLRLPSDEDFIEILQRLRSVR